MARGAAAGLLYGICVGFLQGAPSDHAIVAAMKLTEAPSYSWSSAIADDARSYTIEGRTDCRTDLSLVTMPMVIAVRRRIGTGTAQSDNLSTVAFKGAERFAVETDRGWKSETELETLTPSRRGGAATGAPGHRGAMSGGLPGMPDSGGVTAKTAQQPAYSNLQKTLSRPHEEIPLIVAGATDLKRKATSFPARFPTLRPDCSSCIAGRIKSLLWRPAAPSVCGPETARWPNTRSSWRADSPWWLDPSGTR
jgi:hypothetical protein